MKDNNTYSAAGVNIEQGNKLIKNIKGFVKSTHRKEVMSKLGGFAGLFNMNMLQYKKPILVSGTDGVGTKLMIAREMGKHDTIGVDLVAMCANDILCHGAEPLFFLDYFATGKLDLITAEEVIKGIACACKEVGMTLIGGETAEMPGMYQNNEYDLAGFCVGVVEEDEILPKKEIVAGDVLIGCQSSGLHSNGFSLVRKLLKQLNVNLNDKSPWDNKKWGEILLKPTQLYVKQVIQIMEHIKGVVHITGGGITENIPRILPSDISFTLDYPVETWPEIFLWLKEEGKIAEEEMLKVFNCGIGLVLIASVDKVELIINSLVKQKIPANILGYVCNK